MRTTRTKSLLFCVLAAAGVLRAALAVDAQAAEVPQTFATALGAMTTQAELEEWLQQHAPGLVSYEVQSVPTVPPGPTEARNDLAVQYSATSFNRHTWKNCSLQVEEAEGQGLWLRPETVHRTAVVAMSDVDSIASGVVAEGEGVVSLYLKRDSASMGNVQRGAVVRLTTRYPVIVAGVLLKYSEMCKGHHK